MRAPALHRKNVYYIPGELVALALGLDKDEDLVLRLRADLLEQLGQLGLLLVLLAHVHDLQDVVVGVQLGRADVDVSVLPLEEVLGQAPHLLRPRGGPHEHLRTEVIEVTAIESEVNVDFRGRFDYAMATEVSKMSIIYRVKYQVVLQV